MYVTPGCCVKEIVKRRKAKGTHYCSPLQIIPFTRFHLFLAWFFFRLLHSFDRISKLCSALVSCTCSEKLLFFIFFLFAFLSFSCKTFFLHDFLVPGAPYNNVCEACFLLLFSIPTRFVFLFFFFYAWSFELEVYFLFFTPMSVTTWKIAKSVCIEKSKGKKLKIRNPIHKHETKWNPLS